MRSALDLLPETPCELDLSLKAVDNCRHMLEVQSKIPNFGPQPWLALKTSAGTYHYDNFDIHVPFHRWQYVFDEETFPLNSICAIGVAAKNAYGITTVSLMDPASGKVSKQDWNTADKGL